MFGIDDPFIYLPYLLSISCLMFSIWYGVKFWNKNNDKDELQ